MTLVCILRRSVEMRPIMKLIPHLLYLDRSILWKRHQHHTIYNITKFLITRMITVQIGLHSVLLPLFILLLFARSFLSDFFWRGHPEVLPRAKAVEPTIRVTQNCQNFQGLQKQYKENLPFGPFNLAFYLLLNSGWLLVHMINCFYFLA